MSENIKVALRFRPMNKKELEDKSGLADINIDTKQGVVKVGGNQEYIYDFVFNNEPQESIFNSVAKNAVCSVCEGFNSTIFAYGATSSGKSFTMFGNENGNKEQAGIIPRACNALFDYINNNEQVLEATMKCSFIEIYRENIRDLLNINEKEAQLKLRESQTKGVYIQGLIEKHVYSAPEILETIKEGTKQRTIASTALNSVSSRSHAVLTLNLFQKLSDGSEVSSKLHLIDLAGSENVGRSEVSGISMMEAQTINKSLSSLGNVINALTEKGREHIPYRDSKLTFLLQDSLGGNSKTILIATASPSVLCLSETLSTLKFAKRAKEIKNKPTINKNESTTNLLKIIDDLKARIVELEAKCEDDLCIMQAVEKSKEDDKEKVMLKATVDRLELVLEKERDRNKVILGLYEKHRKYSMDLAEQLCDEKSNTQELRSQLEHIKLMIETTLSMPPDICKSRLNKMKF